MKTAFSQTWTLYTPQKAAEIVANLNNNTNEHMYAVKQITNTFAAVEVFDEEGYSLGYL